MGLYGSATLFDMIGSVKEHKPNASAESVRRAINKRIRKLYDRYAWADSLKTGYMSVQSAYNEGTVDLLPNATGSLVSQTQSSVITGHGTTWPVNDLINSNIPEGVTQIGYQEVDPATMRMLSGNAIAPGQFLVIDPDKGDLGEIVVVTDTTPTSFTANFRLLHDQGCLIYASSLAGMQFKAMFPVYTIQAILTPERLQIDGTWQGTPAYAQPYYILTNFGNVTPFTRRVMLAYDPVAAQPLDCNHSQDDLALSDPQRSSTGNPLWLCQMPPSLGGVPQFEIWPAPLTAYQIVTLTVEQWPELKRDTDIAPWYANPDVIVSGSVADVFRIKVISREGRTDPYYDPAGAGIFERQYNEGVEELIQADQGRQATSLSTWVKNYPGDVNYSWLRGHAAFAPALGFPWA